MVILTLALQQERYDFVQGLHESMNQALKNLPSSPKWTEVEVSTTNDNDPEWQSVVGGTNEGL